MSAEEVIAGIVRRGRAAMRAFRNDDQAAIDDAVTAIAWSLYEPERAREMAELAVRVTGLGTVESKIIKNRRKTFGTLRDLMRVRSTGIIEQDDAKGIVRYARPVGIVAAITPSTNPSATPVNKAMMAVKGGNAVVIAPSPVAFEASSATVENMRRELARTGAPEDLVQIVPAPVDRDRTAALMRAADLVVCTGSQNNVRAASASGTPSIGVGAGNVPVIIDDSADLDDAAGKIAASKCFDNATSCSSENSLVILDAVYDRAIAALERAGGCMASPGERERVIARLWENGRLVRDIIARDFTVLAERFGLARTDARFLMVEETGIGAEYPLSGEKLSLVLTVYRARDFDDARRIVTAILDHQGRGHSIGIHTADMDHARELARTVDVVRVLVNQAHTFANGGGFDTGLPFTLSMGCGTWGGNVISENLNWRHFINITHLVTTIPEDRPREEDLFGAFWEKHGR
ncbi:MAG: aldehyde dehydrogenase family protein [Geminicoccaceae bacterium]|nr:aldehyde dehydrogenase family protein [Geminicoccaceae bacterium]